jgi:hypothetical protein
MRASPLLLRLVFAIALLPMAAGLRIVTYQDALMTHLPAKSATVEQLRAGRIPFVNPYASCGQPLAGNPNFGTFFPDTVFFAALPLFTAFGLHFALAAVLAFAGARRWARAEGASPWAAEAAGFAFALSGVFVSAWRFYNVGMALAVAPWVMAAAAKLVAREGSPRRAAGELALWTALEALAGEPVVALLTVLLACARVLASFAEAGLRRRLSLAALAFVTAALLAGPQLATTLQMFEGSRREHTPYGFAVATYNSMHPARLLEQAIPFPFGRPDLRGPGGFAGHRFFDGHAPYLWTLHLGWPTLALLCGYGRPRSRAERFWWVVAGVALLLSLGQFLPVAKRMYPLLSVDGRLRFPIKWWYVLALCLVPLVGRAVDRWLEGPRPRRAVLVVVAALAATAAFVARDPAALASMLASGAAVAVIAFGPRRGPLVAGAVAGALAVAHLPLVRALVDRPPEASPPAIAGRVYERVAVEAHPADLATLAGTSTVPEFFRRARPELWALTGALSGIGYAFDFDPDGSYADPDRAVRKGLDARSWPGRVDVLRAAGVAHVVTGELLPPPYRPVMDLNRDEGVRLYALDAAASSVRFAGDGTVSTFSESPHRLTAEVSAARSEVLVWSRSFFPAWRATVDGERVRTFVVFGHLVGVEVPAGAHHVSIEWSDRPLLAGVAALLCGLVVEWRLWRGESQGGNRST